MKANAPPVSLTWLQKVWRPEQELATWSWILKAGLAGRRMEAMFMEGRDPAKPIPPHSLPQGTLAPTLPQVQQGCYWGPLARQTPGLSMSQLSPVNNHTGPMGPSRTHTSSGNMVRAPSW